MDAYPGAASSLVLGADLDKKAPKHVDEAQVALEKEVTIFNSRERYFVAFRVDMCTSSD